MTTPDTDVRPPETEVDAIATLQRQLDDLASTVMARVSRRPTGDIEPTLRATPKPDTLICNGVTVSRATYAALWAWVQDQGLAGTGLPFGAGDGSSTFVLPDLRGRAVTGATASRPVGTVYGDPTRVITPGNMAAHTHQVQVAAHGNHAHTADVGSDEVSHTHGFSTSGVGDHGGHKLGHTPGAAGSNATWTNISHFGDGAHGHNGGTGNASNAHGHFVTIFGSSAGGHNVDEVVVGQNTPFNIESPAMSVNYLIWT